MLRLSQSHLQQNPGYGDGATGVLGGARRKGAPPASTVRDGLNCLWSLPSAGECDALGEERFVADIDADLARFLLPLRGMEALLVRNPRAPKNHSG